MELYRDIDEAFTLSYLPTASLSVESSCNLAIDTVLFYASVLSAAAQDLLIQLVALIR